MAVLELTAAGLYCAGGDFYIDPWRGVPKAIITHAHADHARRGSTEYLSPKSGELALKLRLGMDCSVQTLAFGETISIGSVKVSLHPAGHVLGSAWVRVEEGGEVWCFSGDYKTERDVTGDRMEPIRCHTFISESTFGLPIYRWQPQQELFDEINQWWRQNKEDGRCSILCGYSLGKAQRLLGALDPGIGPIGVHGSVFGMLPAYEANQVPLPPSEKIEVKDKQQMKRFQEGGMVIAPPSVLGSGWERRFGDPATAMASGWMTIRGPRRRQNVAKGFPISDHVDWPGLLETIEATGAERIGITHGYVSTVVRYLKEQGKDAFPLKTRFEGERTEEAEAEPDAP